MRICLYHIYISTDICIYPHITLYYTYIYWNCLYLLKSVYLIFISNVFDLFDFFYRVFFSWTKVKTEHVLGQCSESNGAYISPQLTSFQEKTVTRGTCKRIIADKPTNVFMQLCAARGGNGEPASTLRHTKKCLAGRECRGDECLKCMSKRTAILEEVWCGQHSSEWIMGQDRGREGKEMKRGDCWQPRSRVIV